MGNDQIRPYLDGIADWIRHDFDVDVAPVPAAIAEALARLREAERNRASAPDPMGHVPFSGRPAGAT